MTVAVRAPLAAPAPAPGAPAPVAPAPVRPEPSATPTRIQPISGALAFARFAAPPNVLGYCGGTDHDGLVGHVQAGIDGRELVELCRQFEGAWPYLVLIARSAGIADPLDARVVEAYWLGNDLLARVSPALFQSDLEARFRPRTARSEWPWLAGKPAAGARPHHSFHVLEVMPRIGMLRAGQVAAILPAMEQCLIRPATVVGAVADGRLEVAVRPLTVLDGKLAFGAAVFERVLDGIEPVQPGDRVAVHWGWSCGRLEPAQSDRLERVTAEAMARANETI
jgi:Family of unknown function (DUF6390)